ncbi:MAG: HEAT repeat domain-containing protein [bacterium]
MKQQIFAYEDALVRLQQLKQSAQLSNDDPSSLKIDEKLGDIQGRLDQLRSALVGATVEPETQTQTGYEHPSAPTTRLLPFMSRTITNVPSHRPLKNRVGAAWVVLNTMDPSLSYDYVMGMMGGVSRLCICGTDCRKCGNKESDYQIPEGFRALGFYVERASFSDDLSVLWDKVVASIDAGIPVPIFSDDEEGVITGYERMNRLLTFHQSAKNNLHIEVTQPIEEVATFFKQADLLSSMSDLMPISKREIEAVGNWVTFEHRPVMHGCCCLNEGACVTAFGLGAFKEWIAKLPQNDSTEAVNSQGHLECVQWWLDARKAAVQFLIDIAPHFERNVPNLLLRAASEFQTEIDKTLTPLASFLSEFHGQTSDLAKNLNVYLTTAERYEASAINHLKEAYLETTDLPGRLKGTLMQPSHNHVKGRILTELFDLAQNGSRNLRLMALERLSLTKDPKVQEAAAIALKDSDRLVAFLGLAVLEKIAPETSSHLLSEAYQVILERQDADLVPILREILIVLAKIGDHNAQDTLRKALADNGNSDTIADCAARLLFDRWPDHSITTFKNAFEKGSEQERAFSAHYLALMFEPGALIIARQALKDPSYRVRLAVAGILGNSGDPEATKIAIESLISTDDNERASGIYSLIEIGALAVPELIRLLDYPNPTVRAAACFALGRIGNIVAFPALQEHQNDESPQVRANAAEAIQRLKGEKGT